MGWVGEKRKLKDNKLAMPSRGNKMYTYIIQSGQLRVTSRAGVPTPGLRTSTGPRPVRNRTAQQEVNSE